MLFHDNGLRHMKSAHAHARVVWKIPCDILRSATAGIQQVCHEMHLLVPLEAQGHHIATPEMARMGTGKIGDKYLWHIPANISSRA